jgi:sugar lactone lactonase YvrE
MKNLSLLILILLLINKSFVAQTNKSFIDNSLKIKWSTDNVLSIPESVIYNQKAGIFYISNINGNPLEKDQNGFISKMSKDGTINQLKWVTGLNAPKGMGIFEGKLYVADIDELVEIDIASGVILKKYPAKKARFLNDITIDLNGYVYISDSQHNLIYRYRDGKIEIWLSVGNLFNPNGLLIDDNKLLVGCNNYILSVDIKSKHVKTFISETGSIDGLVKVKEDQYLISDWAGNLYLVSKTLPKVKILSTEADKINAADFEYLRYEKLVLIPTFSDNRIMTYELE